MQRVWTEVCPPLPMVMAVYAGWKPKKQKPADGMSTEEFANFLGGLDFG